MKKAAVLTLGLLMICGNVFGVFSRTPAEIADLIKDKIEGKVVVDVGCAEGDFMIAMSKYAKEVRGIEQVSSLAEIATDRGFTVTTANATTITWPVADVYYVYVDRSSLNKIMKKIDTDEIKGTFIFGDTNSYITSQYFILRGAEVRVGAGGHFKVYILEIK